jgi:hypothetical protein
MGERGEFIAIGDMRDERREGKIGGRLNES